MPPLPARWGRNRSALAMPDRSRRRDTGCERGDGIKLRIAWVQAWGSELDRRRRLLLSFRQTVYKGSCLRTAAGRIQTRIRTPWT
jgi:hypothetical protein